MNSNFKVCLYCLQSKPWLKESAPMLPETMKMGAVCKGQLCISNLRLQFVDGNYCC